MMQARRAASEATHTSRRIGLTRALRIALWVGIAAMSPAGMAGAAVTPVGPFDVNLSDRENVRRFFYSVHEASEGIPINWTGNVATCDPGTVSADYLDATLTRINYFRAMAGVRSDVTFTAENNAKAQATALIMSARRGMQPSLSHDPPQSWSCWTQLGRDGAAVSNLAGGMTGPAAIDGLVRDGDVAGHRRTMLNPQILSMGSGSIPASADGVASEAQLMVDNPSPPAERLPARDAFVAWPPKGFVPYQVVFPLWTFVLRDADFANATVTMQRPDGTPVAATITHREDFAGPGLVWLADGLQEGCGATSPQPCADSWAKPGADDAITVTVANVLVAGATQSFTYTVTVFDPAVADVSQTPLAISGPVQPPLNQTTSYQVNTIPNAIGYQWRTTMLSAFALADGAEMGLANFDAAVGGYETVSANFVATGMSAFRLSTGHTGGVAGSGPQTLTLKQTLVPNVDSQLTFRTRARLLDNVTAVVEVSSDDGVHWTTLYREQATDDAAFSDRAVGLGVFAGQHLRLRFRVQNSGTGGTFCCGTEGWYVDDIALLNLQAAAAPTLSAVSAPTSFDFRPTAQAEFDVEVRAQFFGSGFGDWSPALRVSTRPPDVAPLITAQPQNAMAVSGGAATFAVTTSGTPPLEFVWSRDGADLVDGAGTSGSRTATLNLTNVQAERAGAYRVRVSNASGAVTSDAAQLTVSMAPPPPPANDLTGALDSPGLQWTTAGNTSWAPQMAVTHDAADAARSGVITDNQSSSLVTTLNGPATLSFFWKVDSERDFDFLSVDVDGVRPIPQISGNVDWQPQTIALAAGAHTVRWMYAKDSSVSNGQDAAWLDEVTVGPPAATPPPMANGLADAVDVGAAVVLTTAGDGSWSSQTAITHDGMDAAQSGAITHNQSTRLDATVTGPATLKFWWKVDSEANFDFLSVEVDGVAPIAPISGNVDWQQQTIALPAGAHTVRWTYSKDISVSERLDAAWIDQVTLE